MITRDDIKQMADLFRRDPAFIPDFKRAIMETGMAELLGLITDESKLSPFRPCPAHWTAMQLAIFDNGTIPKSRNRPKIQRTKMRFGMNIMVWTQENIDFKKTKASWNANAYFWTAEDARTIVRDLRDEGYVGDETVEKMDKMTKGDATDCLFAVPLLRVGTSTNWMRGHIVGVVLENGIPVRSFFDFPEVESGLTITNEPMADYLANGGDLTGNTILQARLARDPKLGQWATEVI